MADPNDVADSGEQEVVVTDRELYDSAISDTPATPAPEPQAPAEAKAPEPEPQASEERARDEHGRFAPKQPQQAATTQQPAQPQQQQPQQQQPEDNRVPLATLHRERERAQRAEAELQQARNAWAQWQQMQALQAQQAQQAQQPQQAPQTIWDGPDDYIVQRFIAPLRQEMEIARIKDKDATSREFADAQFGKQAVETALNDLGRIRQTPQGDAIFNHVMNAGHPYGALVQWHREAVAEYQRRREIGPDVNAWKQRYGEQLLNDPRWQAAAIERARRGAQQQQGNGNRPPNVSLPPSLSSMPASSGRLEDQGDLSNDSLYRFATK